MNVNKLQNLAMNDNGFIFDPNTGYSYRLRSFSGALYSPYSNEAFDVPNN